MSLVFNTPKSALNTTSKAIQNLKSGECPEPSLTTESVEYTENGEYSVATPEGFDGLSAVSVTVNIDTEAIADAAYAEGEAAQKAKLTSLNVTSNGTYNKEDGYNSVTVNVPSDINNQNKTVSPATSSQSVTADSGYSGLGTVTVEAVTSSIDQNITASNIKDGVTILGVTGTYDPQPSLESKTASYTANGTYTITPSTGYDGMSDVEVTVNVSGGSGTQCPDWSSIGWDCSDVEQSTLADDLAYAAQKKEAFESGTISSFANDTNLTFIPRVVLPANSSFLFSNCTAAKNVPLSFEGQPTNISQMFNKVPLNHQPSFD